MGLNQRRLEPITWIAQEFQLVDEGMQGMCRRGADLRGPSLSLVARKLKDVYEISVKEKRYSARL